MLVMRTTYSSILRFSYPERCCFMFDLFKSVFLLNVMKNPWPNLFEFKIEYSIGTQSYRKELSLLKNSFC